MSKELKDPMGTLFGALQAFKASATGEIANVRASAITTKVGDFTIDTCNTVDAGWETGIKPKDVLWVIVQRYPNEKSAIKGHEKWIESLKDNPDQELIDINYE